MYMQSKAVLIFKKKIVLGLVPRRTRWNTGLVAHILPLPSCHPSSMYPGIKYYVLQNVEKLFILMVILVALTKTIRLQ